MVSRREQKYLKVTRERGVKRKQRQQGGPLWPVGMIRAQAVVKMHTIPGYGGKDMGDEGGTGARRGAVPAHCTLYCTSWLPVVAGATAGGGGVCMELKQ